jgi:benzodiazapine receptor
MYIIKMIKNKILTFIIFLIVTFSASLIGGFATLNYKEPWYSLLNKPIFNPPDWIFAPVWTTLYLMMTFAIWLFWHSKNKDINTFNIYLVQIVINTTWSIVFFVFHQILFSIFVLILLIILIIILIKKFNNVNLISSYLMIPYLLWCCFALVLNLSIYLLN